MAFTLANGRRLGAAVLRSVERRSSEEIAQTRVCALKNPRLSVRPGGNVGASPYAAWRQIGR